MSAACRAAKASIIVWFASVPPLRSAHACSRRPIRPGRAGQLAADPDGTFYLALRLYWPEPVALDGTWVVPLVVRLS